MLDVPYPLLIPLLNVILVCIAPLPSLQNALANGLPVSSGGSDDMTSDDDKRNWSDMRAWGKRDGAESETLSSAWGTRDVSFPDKKWKSAAWGKRDIAFPDKKWKSAAWGKRDIAFPEKKWKSAAWGKRDVSFPDKKWNSAAWGKRDIAVPDKKWKSAAWGKRDIAFPDKKWKSAAWGKRDIAFPDKKWKSAAWGKRDIAFPDKKWKSAAWGKRDNAFPDKKWKSAAWGKRDVSFPDKKWKSAAWGKRVNSDIGSLSDWGEGNSNKRWRASTWGKRDTLAEETAEQEPGSLVPSGKESMTKTLDNVNSYPASNLIADRGWSSFLDQFANEYIPLDTPKAKRKWDAQSDWGKRPSWSRSGITTWGKRSTDTVDLHKLKAALLRLKPALNTISTYD